MEVLVAIVIVAVGLLGLAGLQARMQMADLEAYQRTQAIMLLDDMASRIMAYANGKKQASEVFSGNMITVGTGYTCPTPTTRPEKDICEWSDSLKGAAEVQGTQGLGAMIDARGCLQKSGAVVGGDFHSIVVTVVWQGMTPTVSPPLAEMCGVGLYSAKCPTGNNRCRRAVSKTIRVFNPLTF